MSFFLNMFVGFQDENNDPYYHENLNNDNIDPNENTYDNNTYDNNTYDNNTYENSTNIHDNNYLDTFDNNLNMTIRNFISYITNNMFMYNNSTTVSIEDYITIEEHQSSDNSTVEISSSSEDE